jgi:hypothetical protein
MALTMTDGEVIVLRGPPFILCFIRRCASTVLPSSWATGVGHNEDPIAEMWGTNEGSRDAVPVRIEPERGQVCEYLSEPQGKVPWNVLQQCPLWSKDAKG